MKKFINRNRTELKVTLGIFCIFSLQVAQRTPLNDKASFFANQVGLPFQWLTIYSSTPDRNLWELMFGGNHGVLIEIGEFAVNVFIIFIVVKAVSMLVKYIKSRKVRVYELAKTDEIT